MELDRFIQFCQSENGQTGLAVDRDGILWRGERQKQEASVQEATAQKESKTKEKQEIPEPLWHWKRFEFNKEYQGYYPPCRFTAVAWTGGGFLAAGTEADLFRPVAYSSLRGGVWQPENLAARTPEGIAAPTEPVYDICTDQASGQIFLLGGKGQVITLTGCPNCVKLSHFTDQDIRRGEIIIKTLEDITTKANETDEAKAIKETNREKFLRLTLADGTTAEFPLHAALQLHLSREAAEEKRRQGGIFVYVGDGNGSESEAVEGARKAVVSSVNVSGMLICPLSKLKRFFEACPKEQILVFFCETGVKAEAAAKSARAQGYQQAYYAGEGE